MDVELGDLVRDRVSGMEGIAIGRAEYLYGCMQICVRPRALHEGRAAQGEWFDEGQLEGAVQRPSQERLAAAAGGPVSNPPRS